MAGREVIEGELTIYVGEGPGVRAPTTTPRHGAFYRAITLASRPGGRPPLESVEGSQIKQASRDYGIEFVGPLPDPVE